MNTEYSGSRVLYISYDGLMEPLGQSQVFQYLKELAKRHSITLVTYEKPNDWLDIPRRENLRREVREAGIRWIQLKYHKRPSAAATAYDIVIGFWVCSLLVLTRRIQIVHARSYVPSVIALWLKKLFGVRFIFDMRGFWADERVDGGIWPRGSTIYHLAKGFERRFLLAADMVVSLTRAGVTEIKRLSYLQENMPSFEVIPTCTNLNLFNGIGRQEKDVVNKDRPFTLGYVGSVGTWYLLDEMLEFFKCLRTYRQEARMLFINRNEHAFIRERISAMEIPEEYIEIKSVNHAEVVEEMNRMDVGILFIKPVFSKKASAPTKLGEFLACGIPCIGNSNVGDVEMILNDGGCGVVIDEFNNQTYQDAVRGILKLSEAPDTNKLCRKVAEIYFSLDEGVLKYDAIYRSLNNCHHP